MKIMKNTVLLVSVLVLMSGLGSCKGQGKKGGTSQAINSPAVSVYYFHFTNRCATCMAVEENARNAVEELFPDEYATGIYTFSSLNLDEAGTKEIADKLGVGGQTLMVVHGEKKADITSAAWLAARDPEKMKAEIKSGIHKVMP
jgi:hypothetical protein